MKTTLDLSDALFEQPKATARAQGIPLKNLFETGLQMALNRQVQATPKPTSANLSFTPGDGLGGHLIDPGAWRDMVNERDFLQG